MNEHTINNKEYFLKIRIGCFV